MVGRDRRASFLGGHYNHKASCFYVTTNCSGHRVNAGKSFSAPYWFFILIRFFHSSEICLFSIFSLSCHRSEGGSKHNNKARALQRFPVSQRLPAFAFWCAKAGYLATGKLLPATGVPRMTSRAFPLFCAGLSGPSLGDRV